MSEISLEANLKVGDFMTNISEPRSKVLGDLIEKIEEQLNWATTKCANAPYVPIKREDVVKLLAHLNSV